MCCDPDCAVSFFRRRNRKLWTLTRASQIRAVVVPAAETLVSLRLDGFSPLSDLSFWAGSSCHRRTVRGAESQQVPTSQVSAPNLCVCEARLHCGDAHSALSGRIVMGFFGSIGEAGIMARGFDPNADRRSRGFGATRTREIACQKLAAEPRGTSFSPNRTSFGKRDSYFTHF